METLQRTRPKPDKRRLSETLVAPSENHSVDANPTPDSQGQPFVINAPLDVNQDQFALLDWRIVTVFTLVGTLLLFLL